jgi:arylsulfatase
VKVSDQKQEGLSRRDFIAMGSGLVASQVFGASLSAKPAFASKKAKAAKLRSTRPNVLFVFTDQERFFPRLPVGLKLPGHEKLTRQGVSFNSHYISASMCTSSRSVILTGLQTADNKMFDNTDCPYIPSLSTEIPTVGHLLRKADYYTAYQGKWHLGREFGGHEFDKSLIARMNEYGFADFYSPGDGMAHTWGGYQSDDLITSSAVSWLRRKGRDLSDQKKPWGLFVSLVNPHDIMYFNADAPGEKIQDTGKLLMVPKRAPSSKMYQSKWNVPTPATLKQSMSEAGRPKAHGEYLKAWGHTLGNIPLAAPNWDRFSNFYFNSIKQADQHLLSLLTELESLGLMDNTVVVFTSDHGEMGGHHGLRGKGPFAYEEAIHVPFYVIHPDIAGGQECRALSSHIDITPTLLSLTGMKKEDVSTFAGRELPGKDLSPALSNARNAGVNSVRENVLFAYSGIATNDSEIIRIIAEAKASGQDPKAAVKALGYKPDLKKRGTLRSTFDGRYKFTRYFSPTEHHLPATVEELYKNNDVELYDLKNDPHEIKNLAADRTHNEELVTKLSQQLERVIQQEIGKDDGREMPDFPGIDWTLDRVDL